MGPESGAVGPARRGICSRRWQEWEGETGCLSVQVDSDSDSNTNTGLVPSTCEYRGYGVSRSRIGGTGGRDVIEGRRYLTWGRR